MMILNFLTNSSRRILAGALTAAVLAVWSVAPAQNLSPGDATPVPPGAGGSAEDPFGAPSADPFGQSGGEEAGEVPDFSMGIPGQEPTAEEGMVADALWSSEARGLYVQATSTGFQSVRQVEELAEDVLSASFNRLYAELRTASGVAYRSNLEQSLPVISSAFSNPLGDLKQRLSGRTDVFAVVGLLPVYNAILGSRPPASNPAGRYPGIVNRTLDGEMVASDNMMHMDPGNPLVSEYLASLMVEMDARVKPDGFLFRGLKYPGRRWGYSEDAVAAFRREVGGEGNPPPDDPIWSAWRREQLTRVIRHLRHQLGRLDREATFSVLVEVSGSAPADVNAWLQSETYADNFVDWVTWCREGLVDEIVFEIHEETRPQGMVLKGWVSFINSNCHGVRPLISLSGKTNFTQGLNLQYNMVRSRGVGTILHSYADPSRDRSPGFFASLPNVLFRGRAGRPLRRPPLEESNEVRTFSRMDSPPPAVIPPTRTPRPQDNPLAGRELVFYTPTPVPSPTPIPFVVPEQIIRVVKLRSGITVEARILKVTSGTITIQAGAAAPMELKRSSIESITPPI